MVITKKIEIELAQWLQNYWATYLRGDLETWASFLKVDYYNIGGTKEEIWHSRQEILDYTIAIMDQVLGKAELRNQSIEAEAYGDFVMVNEFTDMYVLIDGEWIFYGPFRMSSLMEKTATGWIVQHQHGSYPDMKATEGEAYAADALRAENLQLQSAIDERTKELENKNKELEIEAALERVRTVAMGMDKPDDMLDVCRVISDQLQGLGISGLRNVQTAIFNPDHETYMNYEYFSGPNKTVITEVAYKEQIDVQEFATRMLSDPDAFFTVSFTSEQVNAFIAYQERVGQFIDPKQYEANKMHYYFFSIGPGALGISTYLPCGDDQLIIIKRFRNVFELAYKRYADIELAAAQAREAQIELALERVRARTMAMHNSEELKEVIQVVYEQFVGLNIHVDHAGFILNYKEREDMHIWQADHQQGVTSEITIPYFDSPHWNSYVEAKATGQNFFTNLLPFEVKNKFYQDLFELIPELTEEAQQAIFRKPALAISTVLLDNVGLYIEHYSETPFTGEENKILMRFGNVFQQTYTRFLDLQKAESQAREALIEAALERVRSRSLAMHKTDELQEVVRVLAEELKHTGVILDTWGAVICTYFQDSKDVLHWTAAEDPANPSTAFLLPYFEDELFDEAWTSKNRGDSYFAKVFSYNVKNAFFNHAFEHSDYRHLPDDYKQMILLSESHGIAWAWAKNSAIMIPSINGDLPSEEEKEILIRFAKVFEQAFIRFLDLQKVESQAREAQVELSLEKIRAQVASMQESTDLLDIMVNIRSEFVWLGHEAHYFWYMRWLPDKYEKAMTSGDGTQVGMVMTLPRHIHGDIPLVANWERGEEATLIFPMEMDTAVDYVDKMITLGDFVQVDPHAPTLDDIRHIQGLTFVMARTSQGEIGFSLPGYVPNPSPEAVATLARFAGVFDLAYKRFEDLKKAEKDFEEIKAARERAEEALIELKATQSQLVQQEKLASLGQLTAGIAHEIKNPLNFVNNFSEVSIEMIEEILEARSEKREARSEKQETRDKNRGDESEELENEILEDIKGNLKKIHEHGSRANGIVTSMLQHSRGGTGKKEPTDLNALIKEYSNLAFHGMRAGKTPINVAIDLQLDEQIKEVPLIGEDFSRVLLNLCNNAFDAMRATADERPPKLTIRTKLQSEKILIEVEDNGPGIPDEIKDKILQPFFTTKKGTEGTGLGLSITHDIIKAHGGELRVETKVGDGTTFIIELEKKA